MVRISSHHYPLFSNWIHVHAPILFIIVNKSQCFIGVIHICHPLQVDVLMGASNGPLNAQNSLVENEEPSLHNV
jgi:hypothetical protein